MNWIKSWPSKKALISDIIKTKKPWIDKNKDKWQYKYLYHSTANWNELWTVWSVMKNNQRIDTIIQVHILRKFKEYDWGYKTMNEAMCPRYYGCPKKFLKITPVKNFEWRRKVLSKFKHS